jgi:hypothetical protein
MFCVDCAGEQQQQETTATAGTQATTNVNNRWNASNSREPNNSRDATTSGILKQIVTRKSRVAINM